MIHIIPHPQKNASTRKMDKDVGFKFTETQVKPKYT